MLSTPKQEAFYQELVALVGQYASHLSGEEMLAVAANAVGKIVALQDQRTTTPARAMEIVARNIELGNQHVLLSLMDTKGNG